MSLDQPTTILDLCARANKYVAQEDVMKMVQSREVKEERKREMYLKGALLDQIDWIKLLGLGTKAMLS